MSELRYTLVGDGTSDRRLIPVLNWLILQHSNRALAATWADLSILRTPPRTLAAKIRAAQELYPADLLFVHRDAEAAPREQRSAEIAEACVGLADLVTVPVVPVRMQEAWLLISEDAIRMAAGHPKGRTPLTLPQRGAIERDPDPKRTLYDALKVASGLSGRHLARFNVAAAAYRVSELIEDYSALRGVSAFDALEQELTHALRNSGLA